MIRLTKLNGQSVAVNADLIEMVEETPDCLLTLTTGRKLMVRESMEAVREAFLEYRRQLGRAYPVPSGGPDYDPTEIAQP
ncbi:MAG: flagellar FlbD family protein [Candidatus Krumholzibacteriia bacterium]|nr:flagellar FlbD family protein [bacterium]MCB9515194.1 flagellar FlbD family protein [Candidatus Latescibacterota bacterium]